MTEAAGKIMNISEVLLRVSDLDISFKTDNGVITAASGVSFSIKRGEVMALVGESGSGKSVTALSLLRLLATPPASVKCGAMEFTPFSQTEGNAAKQTIDLSVCSAEELRDIRGNRISMIFQEPMTSLNPTLTIERQITETLQLHKGVSRSKAVAIGEGLLAEVGIPEPGRQLRGYPHQLSGGMRQRVMIAMALSCQPDLLIADEPTTALDVTIQAQIMELINNLRLKNNMAVLLITHNMGIVAEMADSVAVMYAGQIVELSSSREIFTNTLHPYTKGLLESVPSLTGEKKKLAAIPGAVPSPRALPKGCHFHPRCSFRRDECSDEANPPQLTEVEPGHYVRCPYYAQTGAGGGHNG